MRALSLFVCALSLAAQPLAVPCEPSISTLRTLEAVPPISDVSLSFEQRVGALRALAVTHPDDFFIQRAYQDAFRQHRTLSDEFDRALEMYHAWPAAPLARYWEARLLRWHEPKRSMANLEEFLITNPRFVWPHLDLSEWNTLPGQRDDPRWATHLKAFQDACPSAFAPGMVQDLDVTRRALERRNSSLELQTWSALWRAEESAGVSVEELGRRVQADISRIEAWPFRAESSLFFVYKEAARILNDASLLSHLRTKVERVAPGSSLALQLVLEDWYNGHSGPDRNSSPQVAKERQDGEMLAYRLWVKRWPNSSQLLTTLVMNMNSRAMTGEALAVSPEDVTLIDQAILARDRSPDAGEMWPPIETAIARIYVAAKVRLVRVPDLLGAAMIKIQRQTKYELSPDLFPAELRRNNSGDWVTLTTKQVEETRVDYLLAGHHSADARTLIQQALDKWNAEKQAGHASFDPRRWMLRLAEADAQEGRVKDALGHYQTALAGLDQAMLNNPQTQWLWGSPKHYYLAHGGSEDGWATWALAGRKDMGRTERMRPPFVTALPEFSAVDIKGKTWTLGDLKGKATFVNFWATWCGPCRAEHAAIEALMQRVKGRKDIRVLTITIDDYAAPVTKYMEEQRYTFPVIHAPKLADKLFPYVGLPTTFLVDARGERTGLYGFGPGSIDEVIERIVRDLTQAAK